jgi:hypothetical protein
LDWNDEYSRCLMLDNLIYWSRLYRLIAINVGSKLFCNITNVHLRFDYGLLEKLGTFVSDSCALVNCKVDFFGSDSDSDSEKKIFGTPTPRDSEFFCRSLWTYKQQRFDFRDSFEDWCRKFFSTSIYTCFCAICSYQIFSDLTPIFTPTPQNFSQVKKLRLSYPATCPALLLQYPALRYPGRALLL